MDRISTLNDLLYSLLERGARLVDWSAGDAPAVERPIDDLCRELVSAKGEASGVALAAEVLKRFEGLDAEGRLGFFRALAQGFEPDPDRLRLAAARYQATPSPEARAALERAVEPPRQELFRRLNFAPQGTRRLVMMRTELLRRLKDHPELSVVDADLAHLLNSWFNRGFLVLQPIDWRTPATILDKIIQYEAVHEIDSWEELRRRIEPTDRRCFAFFHPAMPEEPLIFVEIALTGEMSASVQTLLAADRTPMSAGEATTAVFYSISNCQEGLRGVSFGAFLIKQVASDLARALPNLTEFVTLSPVPGFAKWLREIARDAAPGSPAASAASVLSDLDWPKDPAKAEAAKAPIMTLAARYFLEAKRADQQPLDPVARFHLGNGASLARINWLADLSAKGLARSAGVMVNYRYDLEAVEARHEAYAERRAIEASRQVRALLPPAEKPTRRNDAARNDKEAP